MRSRSLLVAVLALALAVHGAAPSFAAPEIPLGKSWRWLTNTYWIVPSPYLPAVLFNPSTQRLQRVSDQTVYHITGYRHGYFWGKNVTQLGERGVQCASLVGSVTPDGQLLLNFTVANRNGSVSLQQGFGSMVKRGGQWTMLNQTGATNFAHWAYMVQSKPGDPSWTSLPGVGGSVEDFLAQCPGNGPQPGKRLR